MTIQRGTKGCWTSGVVALLAIVMAAPWPLQADTMILKSGTRYTGKIVKKSAEEVVFDARFGDAVNTITISRQEVLSLTEDASGKAAAVPAAPAASASPAKVDAVASGPTYLPIPIRGTIGLEVIEPVIRQALNVARIQKPTVVLLEIDSGGGLITEMDAIIKTLREFSDLRIVAYVEGMSASAAAITAMSCKEIVMAPAGTLGGCVPFTKDANSRLPVDVAEKFRSIFRAQARAIIESAGHDPLLADAMMDLDVVVSTVPAGGKVALVEDATGKMLKPKGKILTLTAQEAKDLGLTLGNADSLEACGELLGAGGWKRLEVAQGLFDAWGKKVKDVPAEYKMLSQRIHEQMDKFELNLPNHTTFTVDSQGRFTPDAKRKWQDLVEACIKSLTDVDAKVSRAREILARYPQFVSLGLITDSDKSLADFKAKIDASLEQARKERNRTGKYN